MTESPHFCKLLPECTVTTNPQSKPTAIDLSIGNAVKFMPKNGKPEFFTIQQIEAFRDAYRDEGPKRNDGVVMTVNR